MAKQKEEVTLFDSELVNGISEKELEALLSDDLDVTQKTENDEFCSLLKKLKSKHNWNYSKILEYVRLNIRQYQEKHGIKTFLNDMEMVCLLRELVNKK
jgi:aromatic ring-opening dioxygenase LigB subunit